jgi:hypothetical protein
MLLLEAPARRMVAASTSCDVGLRLRNRAEIGGILRRFEELQVVS